ncbi:hypothetical protein [Brevundimonas sp.]|uniref:hypothetical protein n=1 Tax=Brevundimonas sp. TaxID=1871086 RepID=UPI0028AE05F9|nr:hypothetical protein [Brevundimonas sp.]
MTIEAYVKVRQLALAREIAPRRKLYLDLNFWIRLRDAALGLPTDTPTTTLLSLLRQGVGDGKLICPIGDNVFQEVMKQPYSEDRRIGMARLIDELSLGVSFLVSDRRLGTEIYIALHRLLDRPGVLHPMQELVWTKVCHVIGEAFPVLEGLDPEALLDLQRDVVDDLWACSFQEMIERIGNQPRAQDPHQALSEETNRERDAHVADITSYARAYKIELRGGVDACGKLAADALCGMAESDGFTAPRFGEPDWMEMKTLGTAMLLRAFDKQDAADVVRTLHIETSLHAAMRVDKARRFKPNDFYDFRHAAAALAYCDAFFTEGPLCDLVSRRQLGLLGINDCRVATDVEDALGVTQSLIA